MLSSINGLNPDDVIAGAPIIASDGKFARVEYGRDDSGKVMIVRPRLPEKATEDFWMVVEVEAPTASVPPATWMDLSPVMSVLVTQTALPQ